jgi:glutathione S-transferase
MPRVVQLAVERTAVDPFVAVFYRWGCRIGVAMVDDYPNWTAHIRRFEARPAVQRALVQEGILLWR